MGMIEIKITGYADGYVDALLSRLQDHLVIGREKLDYHHNAPPHRSAGPMRHDADDTEHDVMTTMHAHDTAPPHAHDTAPPHTHDATPPHMDDTVPFDGTILEQAQDNVYGPAMDRWGDPEQNLRRIGRAWGAILGEGAIAPDLVALCMAAVALIRYEIGRDQAQVVDAVGWASLVEHCAQDSDGDMGL